MPYRPDPGRKRKGHHTSRHQRLRAQVIAEEVYCGVCGGIVDKTLPGTDPMGPTIGHIQSVRFHPELEFDRDNVELEHRECNLKEGSGQ